MITVICKIIGGKLRLRLIQPEGADAQICIILPAFLPHVLPCARVGGIHEHIVAVEDHLHVHAGIAFYQKSLLLHLLVILTAPVHLRPDGYHHPDTHILYLPDHRRRIREIFLVKTPVTAPGPMVVIDHQHIYRNLTLLVFPGNLQHLLLIVIAQLALPEAQTVLRHHRRPARHGRIGLLDLCRRVSRRDPVIQLPGIFRDPFRSVAAEMHLAYGRIMPQKAIPQAGNIERNTGL